MHKWSFLVFSFSPHNFTKKSAYWACGMNSSVSSNFFGCTKKKNALLHRFLDGRHVWWNLTALLLFIWQSACFPRDLPSPPSQITQFHCNKKVEKLTKKCSSRVCIHVFFESRGFSERFTTLVAFVRFFPSVNASMFFEWAWIRKHLVAVGTMIWTVTRVNARVCFQLRRNSKSAVALCAFVWAFICVCSHVLSEITALSKLFTTLLAFERLFAGVNASVFFQLMRKLKCAVALCAFEWALICVWSHVLSESTALSKRFTTFSAFVQLFAGVNARVCLQLIQKSKSAVALCAFEWAFICVCGKMANEPAFPGEIFAALGTDEGFLTSVSA